MMGRAENPWLPSNALPTNLILILAQRKVSHDSREELGSAHFKLIFY